MEWQYHKKKKKEFESTEENPVKSGGLNGGNAGSVGGTLTGDKTNRTDKIHPQDILYIDFKSFAKIEC